MSTQTETGGAAPAAPVKMTIEAELAAALAEAGTQNEATEAAAAAAAEAAPKVEATETAPKVEPKVEEKPPEPTLARRLALVAKGEADRKAAELAREKAAAEEKARLDEMKPLIERIQKAKTAKTRMEAAQLALGLDDEGMAELFLELHRHHEGREEKPKDPTADLEKLVATKLAAALKERDDAAQAERDKQLADGRAWQAKRVGDALKEKGDDFPLVAIAPPSEVDITSISEAWIEANGEIPEPEAVLKLIQDERQAAFDERRAAAEAKKAKATAPAAAAKPAGETSGAKPKPPVAGNDVPVTKPRKLTIEEELRAAFATAEVTT